eukprot:Hpha_TRINITY_DN15055_c4_g7::TRINITY_DN15055_c4_g7_i1::g.126243::m.126243
MRRVGRWSLQQRWRQRRMEHVLVGRVERVSCFPASDGSGWRRTHKLENGSQAWDIVEYSEEGSTPGGGTALGDRVRITTDEGGRLLSIRPFPSALPPAPEVDSSLPPVRPIVDLVWWWTEHGADACAPLAALRATLEHAATTPCGAKRAPVTAGVAVVPSVEGIDKAAAKVIAPPPVRELAMELREEMEVMWVDLRPRSVLLAAEELPQQRRVEVLDARHAVALCLAAVCAEGGDIALVAGDPDLVPVVHALQRKGAVNVVGFRRDGVQPRATALEDAATLLVPLTARDPDV